MSAGRSVVERPRISSISAASNATTPRATASPPAPSGTLRRRRGSHRIHRRCQRTEGFDAWTRPRDGAFVEGGGHPMCQRRDRTQNRRADNRVGRGANAVPTSAPLSACAASDAAASRTGTPESAARRAAESFDAMPPVPRAPPEPATTPSRSSGLLTSGISVASPFRGSPSYSPSTSDNRINASAPTR